MKSIFYSRTIWLAIIQAIVAVAVAVLTELDMVAQVAILKSVIDIILRYDTTEPLK